MKALALAAAFACVACLARTEPEPEPEPDPEAAAPEGQCDRIDELVPHGHLAQRWWLGGCFVWCDDPGWLDCDGNLDDGCETYGSCSLR